MQTSNNDLQKALNEHIQKDLDAAKENAKAMQQVKVESNAVTLNQLLVIEGSFISLLILVIGFLLKTMVNDKLKEIMTRLTDLDTRLNNHSSDIRRIDLRHERLKTYLEAKGLLEFSDEGID